LVENTNLTLNTRNQTYSLIDGNNNRYKLKILSKQQIYLSFPGQRGNMYFPNTNQEKYEKYYNTQTFIIASIVKFPVVKFKLIKGNSLLKNFPTGKIKPSEHNIIFPY
jgi:hypothetical protein